MTKKKLVKERAVTVSELVYEMIGRDATDDAIRAAVARRFPESLFNEHSAEHLGWYRGRLRRERR
jgi:hypothetical protein